MARIQRIARPLPALLLVLCAACAPDDRRAPPELNQAEIRLVAETVEMIRIRLTATRDSAAAATLREQSGDLYTEEEREFLLERLARDSARGEAVMDALHDSLETLRQEFFPSMGR